jgi:glycosyltransferase involved in cell wall biosynthesis
MLTCYLKEIIQIRKTLGTIQPDLVHSWGSEDVCGLGGAFGGIERRLFTLQGCLTEYLRLLGGGALFRLQALYEKPVIKCFSHGTAETPAAAELLQSINSDMAIKLVDYGVNHEFFEATWDPAPCPVVAFVGSVSQRKGIHDLIAIARLPAFSNIRFIILGDGDLLIGLREHAPKNVRWLGRCDRVEVIHQLSSAWCLFMPTYADTGPTVVKESRVMGLPVVTTTGAGASCYVEEAKSGFVTAPGDIESMSRALLQVCSSSDVCLAMGRHGWKEAREQLHPRMTAAKFAAIYRELTSDL